MNENLPTERPYLQFRRYYKSIAPLLDKPKNRAYTTVILTFLTISLFSWFAIKPTISTIITLKKEIEDKTKIDKQMEDKIANLIEVQSIYQNLQDSLTLLTDAIPVNSNALDAVRQMSVAASSTEATISAISVSDVPLLTKPQTSKASKAKKDSENNIFNNFDIRTDYEGEYVDLEKFLTDINTIRRILMVQSLSIKPYQSNVGPGQENNLKVGMQIKSLYQK